MAKGRKRKKGKRTPSGQLSRAKPRAVTYDKGTDRAQMKFSVYGADGSDAIGRAYQSELLGQDGLELRNLARKVFRAYWPMLSVGREKSCLGLDVNGQAVNDDLLPAEERQYKIDRERKLTQTLRQIDLMGPQARKAFDQLCIDIHPDCGPSWLDAIIYARKKGMEPDIAHRRNLDMALRALREISNEW